jgi:hypothetical protein
MEDYPTIGNMFGRMMSASPDPIHMMMIKRKQQMDNQDNYLPPELKYKDNDIKELQEFCKQYGILGFNCGNMPPRTALRMLKNKMGISEKEDYNKRPDTTNLLLG